LEKSDKLANGRDCLTLHLLGKVYADLGRIPEAVVAERSALQLAVEQGNSVLMDAINEHLAQMPHGN
jgi:hypothetical protein